MNILKRYIHGPKKELAIKEKSVNSNKHVKLIDKKTVIQTVKKTFNDKRNSNNDSLKHSAEKMSI